MGCNYYLHKKDNTSWVVPVDSFVQNLEVSIIKSLKRGDITKDDTISLHINKCVCEENGLHIGKSSLGWHFNLCIYPSLNIYNLEDWKMLFKQDDYVIKDEYGEEITVDAMLDCITNRKAIEFDKYKSLEEYEEEELKRINDLKHAMSEGKDKPFATYDDFLKSNHASRGKNGLLSRNSNIWDERNDEGWADFMPMMSVYFHTNGTYDLTTTWDFS